MLTAEQGKKACERVMKFTPGPWTTKFNFHEPTKDDPSPANIHSIDIVTSDWYSKEDYGDAWVADVHQQFNGAENGWANAKLIAAAPELLDALIKLVADVLNKPNDTRYATHLKIAQDAIDKATQ